MKKFLRLELTLVHTFSFVAFSYMAEYFEKNVISLVEQMCLWMKNNI